MPTGPTFSASVAAPGVLLVTITREKQMNSIPTDGHIEGATLFSWFDHEPSLTVAVITGQGQKAFCAGADLIEAGRRSQAPNPDTPVLIPAGGFAGLSRRSGKKPVIAAVNGFALGGGFEICLNWSVRILEREIIRLTSLYSDAVVAAPNAKFGLTEVTRGLYAGAGGLSRLVRVVGMHRASELALTGRHMDAQEAKSMGAVNIISQSRESVVEEAVKLAARIAAQSPDAVIVTRSGLRESWETASVERASQQTADRFSRALMTGENVKIGLTAFAQKKQPQWIGSKL